MARSLNSPLPIATLLKSLIPLLVNGTKEKNSMVKASCEQALVAVLGIRQANSDGHLLADVTAALDAGARGALQDCVQKSLRKAAAQNEPNEEEFDETLISN